MQKIPRDKIKFLLLLSTILIGFSACAHDPYCIKRNSKGKYIGHYKIGKPYVINGKQYKREVNEEYEEIGIASYYGENDGFHGKRTANGDIFNKNALTAAHKTLPLPSMVRVTNLENKRSIILMVNDGGPYVDGRIIDVSVRAAEILGFKKQGLAKVKVKYLPLHTRRLYADLNLKVPTTPVIKPVNFNNKTGTRLANLNNELEKRIKNAVKDTETENKKYFIQIGAYVNHNNAINVMRNLNNLGNSSLITTKVNGKDLHKIHLGPFKNQQEAENILTKVSKLGNFGAKIIDK